ncbi:Piwi domain-containing protein, partial [Vibrio parahaemolyticus]|uniref:Piwi domain-containing protein n=1 Tax=Vibrio parahaemolyticus TaxID=670 RepID=UPI002114078B
EIMTSIGKMVKEAVLKYFAFNGKKFLPEYIIFFRDGVAENQLGAILNFETKVILEQLKTINPDYNCKFAEIVVTKRIDDRIFATEG